MEQAIGAELAEIQAKHPPREESPEAQALRQRRTDHILGMYQDKGVKEEEIRANLDTILETEDAQLLCRACDGTRCLQATAKVLNAYRAPDRYFPLIEVANGRIYSRIRRCKWGEQQDAQAKIDRAVASAHVPDIYGAATFADFQTDSGNREAYKAAHWITVQQDSAGRGLYFYGPRGTGKTMLASIIANERARKGLPVLFVSVPRLLEDIRRTYNTDGHAAVDRIADAMETPFAIFDDLGAERMTPWVGEQLYSIVNLRYEARLQTVFTSNYDTDELLMHLTTYDNGAPDDIVGQRIVSRIVGMCEIVALKGNDWRMK